MTLTGSDEVTAVERVVLSVRELLEERDLSEVRNAFRAVLLHRVKRVFACRRRVGRSTAVAVVVTTATGVHRGEPEAATERAGLDVLLRGIPEVPCLLEVCLEL